MTRRPPRSPWRALGIVTLTAAVTTIAGFLALAIAPPIWAATQTTLAGTGTIVVLSSGGRSVDVAVPEGWRIRPAFAEESGTVLTTPDGAVSVSLSLVAAADPELAIRAIAPGPFGALSTESVGPRAALTHARTDDGTASVGALSGPGGTITFVMQAGPAFDAELSALLSGIQVDP